MRARAAAVVESKMARARTDAAAALADSGEVPCSGIVYGENEVLSDWLP
jgi:hypothetical protein